MIAQCVVAAHGHGGPDLFFVKVQCTEQQYEEGDHYQGAEEWARNQDLDGPYVTFDDKDPPKAIFELFEWDTASTVDVDGNEVVEGFIYE